MAKVKKTLDNLKYPSFRDQVPWKTGYFNFGKQEFGDLPRRFFNPSVIEHNGSDWLVVRRAEDIEAHKLGINTIWAFRLDENHVPVEGCQVGLRGYKTQHYEDPRIIRLSTGEMLLSYTTFVIEVKQHIEPVWFGAHIQTALLDQNFQPIVQNDPVYGGNQGSVRQCPRNEKNWLWFEHDGQLHLIYMTEPHEVVQWFGESYGQVYETDFPLGYSEIWGHPRGGTPPVRIGDEYWSFFHSSTVWRDPKRRYHMGCYAFEAKPPFRITRCSSRPICSGSMKDPWWDGQPLVVFPCGAIFRNGQWFVTLGINDMVSGWMEIPHADLEKTVQYVTPETVFEAEAEGEPESETRVCTVSCAVESGRPGGFLAGERPVGSEGTGIAVDSEGQFTRPDGRPTRRRIRRRRGKGLRSDLRVERSNQDVVEPGGN